MSVAQPGWQTVPCGEKGATGVGGGSKWTVQFGYAVVSPQTRHRIVGVMTGRAGGLRGKCGRGRGP